MKYQYTPLFFILALLFTACDQLGLNPDLQGTDCLDQADKDNYANLIANEKGVSATLTQYGFNVDNVPEAERQTLSDDLKNLNDQHDTYRHGFDCQYWGEDNDFLNFISLENEDIDPDFLDPAVFKSKFMVTDDDVLASIGQSDWTGKEVYVFPGISRIPWEDASQAAKEDAIERINGAYNKIRSDAGFTDETELFDPVLDYIFPHATYHQVYVSNFASLLSNMDNTGLRDLVAKMESVEHNIITKFIDRAPDTID
ncbi:MAG: hypothetical protein HYZ16_08540 [Bacteroidetes bacterium]|jgi:hypothetical protein|nr:hypothetical protein [Bacteroidota bacterium]